MVKIRATQHAVDVVPTLIWDNSTAKHHNHWRLLCYPFLLPNILCPFCLSFPEIIYNFPPKKQLYSVLVNVINICMLLLWRVNERFVFVNLSEYILILFPDKSFVLCNQNNVCDPCTIYAFFHCALTNEINAHKTKLTLQQIKLTLQQMKLQL